MILWVNLTPWFTFSKLMSLKIYDGATLNNLKQSYSLSSLGSRLVSRLGSRLVSRLADARLSARARLAFPLVTRLAARTSSLVSRSRLVWSSFLRVALRVETHLTSRSRLVSRLASKLLFFGQKLWRISARNYDEFLAKNYDEFRPKRVF
jgi:hypothetical protein